MVGWEEFRHYYGNSTFDDNVTQGSTKYLKYKHTIDTTVRFVKFTGKLPIRKHYEKIRDVEPGREREMYNKLFRVKTRTMNADPEYAVARGPHDYAAKNIYGFRTSTFMQNLRLFMEYLKK